MSKVALRIHIQVHAEVSRCGEIMALHIGPIIAVGGRQETTSYTTTCAFKLHPVNSREPVKNSKQKSHRVGGGCAVDGRQAAISLAAISLGER